ncbi:MAG TPA: DUF167 domain-containing protein [Verrucomicrobiae bacterium]
MRKQGDGICISIKAQPRASRNEIGASLGNELKIKITAPPVDSAANDALLRYLAEVLGCGRGDLQLIRGQTSRHKQVLISNLSAEEIVTKIEAARRE